MGYERDTTPTLDTIAEDGLVFENAIAPGPSTPESMPAIMTGLYPVDTRESYPSLLAKRRSVIHRHMKTHETVAECFQRRGYTTAGFTPNPYTSRYFGFDAGFDRYEDFIGGSREALYDNVLDRIGRGTPLGMPFPIRVLVNGIRREEVFKPWEAFYKRIAAWTHHAEKPYFLWILLMDTHDPYLAPAAYRTHSRWAMYQANWQLWRQGHEPPLSSKTRTRLIRAYDDAVRYADQFLHHLRIDLSDDDPVIAAHADHGEAFGEHDTYGHNPRLYEENVHVPLVVDGVPAETIEDPISLRSIPDFLTSLGCDGERPAVDQSAISHTTDENRWALRGNVWKYIHSNGATSIATETTSGVGRREELYDLALNPREGTEVENKTLRTICRHLIAHSIETNREHSRLAAAARALATGERL